MRNERFWVHVTERDGETITATVNNDLVSPDHGLKYGDRVRFQIRHIYSIFKGD